MRNDTECSIILKSIRKGAFLLRIFREVKSDEVS